MFCLTNPSNRPRRQRSSLIAALDGIVAFATLESYGVVDKRDIPPCEVAEERILRAERRASARSRLDQRCHPKPQARSIRRSGIASAS